MYCTYVRKNKIFECNIGISLVLLKIFVNTKELSLFSLVHVTRTFCICSLIYHSDVKNQSVHALLMNNAKLFKRGRSVVIEVVPNSHFSFNESTMSVPGEVERN